MKKLVQIIYPIRIILFIIHFLLLYVMLDNIIYINPFGYIFLLVDIIYIIRIIIELIAKDLSFKKDIYYNIMQIGLYSYIGVLWYRLKFSDIIYNNELLTYLKINYVILSILMVFLTFYSTSLIKKINK